MPPWGPPTRPSWGALAQRAPRVVPVGVWVESAPGGAQEIRPFESALEVQEELEEHFRERAAQLSRFQRDVRQRVTQLLRLRRKQLQKSRQVEPGPSWSRAAPMDHGEQNEPSEQQSAQPSESIQQVRRKLASRKTAAAPELPGGVWRREDPGSRQVAAAPVEEPSEELPLTGHHDLPAEPPAPHWVPQDDFYIKIEFKKDSHSPESPRRLRPDSRAPLILWAGADQEETKKQRQNEFLRSRRLFMNLERQQVKEQQRQKRIARIKGVKEKQRWVAEQRMQEVAEQRDPSPGEQGPCETLAQLNLEERRARKLKEKQRNKERARYIEALRAQMREKIQLHNISLPPLCSCGADFWDSHPDTCANNCVFYKNHQAYGRALRSIASSCAADTTGPSARLPLPALAALCARPGPRP
ncbi:coiled-coil domain-containing protein 15 [Caloenas nicobarica]|uniref:coiled-coil domain-containing protein 15 n=1 Tax=Caloenas nicobarica TaxID=187106 RepID=UPI0032B7D193